VLRPKPKLDGFEKRGSIIRGGGCDAAQGAVPFNRVVATNICQIECIIYYMYLLCI